MIRRLRSRRDRAQEAEREKMSRLEDAERDLQYLKERGDRAIRALDARHGRNHWGESIERLIQGA